MPALEEKVANVGKEVEALRAQREKGDISIQRLRALSIELTKSLESSLESSKRAQEKERQERENLTANFSDRVKDISLRLKLLETNKLKLAHDNETLRTDLSDCINRASIEHAAEIEEEDSANADDFEVNLEHESMIFEDFRTQSSQITMVDEQLQAELSTFVDRFQELSTILSANNKDLLEHKTRVQGTVPRWPP